MAYVITSLCVNAGACVEPCPTESIKAVAGDKTWAQHYINPDTCIDCGVCMSMCDAGAIFPLDDVPAEYKGDIALNAKFYVSGPGKDL